MQTVKHFSFVSIAAFWRAWNTCSSLWMPLYKPPRVRLSGATALCFRALLFFVGVAAVAEAHRAFSINSGPPRSSSASQKFGEHFDVIAVLNTFGPFSHTAQSCNGAFKVWVRASVLHGDTLRLLINSSTPGGHRVFSCCRKAQALAASTAIVVL